MVFFSFRTLGYAWAGLATTALLSAAALEASYAPPPAPMAASVPPMVAAAPTAPLEPRQPPPAHPALKREAALPVPPVPPAGPKLRTARVDRGEPPEAYGWGASLPGPAAEYQPQYAAVLPYYSPYYGWRRPY